MQRMMTESERALMAVIGASSVMNFRHLKNFMTRALFHLAVASFLVSANARAAGDVVTPPTPAAPPTLSTTHENLPFEIHSAFEDGIASGAITARLDFSFAVVSAALWTPAAWCEFVTLHLNVKGCVYHDVNTGDENAGGGLQRGIIVYSGHKAYQTLADAYALDYDFAASQPSPTERRVTLSAARGPIGTKDYRIEVMLRDVASGATELHITYQYHVSTLARLSFDTYLATAGARKVGFTVIARDGAGRPVYVDGERGVMERNAMRYYLAIQAYLEGRAVPAAQRAEWMTARWFDLTEQHALQLHEITRTEYLANKRREFQQQSTQQATLNSPSARQ